MRELKEWIKPEFKKSLTKIGNIEFGLLDEKEDYCYVHKSNYINELHKLFSGEKWLGCPKCREEMQDKIDQQRQQKDHQLRLEQIKEAESTQQPIIKKAKGF